MFNIKNYLRKRITSTFYFIGDHGREESNTHYELFDIDGNETRDIGQVVASTVKYDEVKDKYGKTVQFIRTSDEIVMTYESWISLLQEIDDHKQKIRELEKRINDLV